MVEVLKVPKKITTKKRKKKKHKTKQMESRTHHALFGIFNVIYKQLHIGNSHSFHMDLPRIIDLAHNVT